MFGEDRSTRLRRWAGGGGLAMRVSPRWGAGGLVSHATPPREAEEREAGDTDRDHASVRRACSYCPTPLGSLDSSPQVSRALTREDWC